MSRSLIDVRDVSKNFGGVQALHAATLEITDEHKIWGMVGPNGSGKSTLFNLIAGVDVPSEGTISVLGRQFGKASPAARARNGVARTFQLPRVFPELTVVDNLLAAGRWQDDPVSKAAALLDLVELGPLAAHRAGELSIGQQKLVEAARALMLNPQVLLLDEIAAGINPRLLQSLLAYIRRIADSGVTIFMVEHNMDVIRELCTHAFALHDGHVMVSGTVDEVLADETVRSAYLGN